MPPRMRSPLGTNLCRNGMMGPQVSPHNLQIAQEKFKSKQSSLMEVYRMSIALNPNRGLKPRPPLRKAVGDAN